MIIEDWFPTPIAHLSDMDLTIKALPVAIDILSKEENINQDLSATIGVNSKITLNKTNVSNDLRLKEVNEKLCNYCKEFLIATGYKPDISPSKSNLYFNNLDYGGSQVAHQHTSSPVTGVMYLDIDDNSAPLNISSPLQIIEFAFDTKRSNNTRYNSSYVTYKPEQGRILIFPGWASHFVTTNYTKNRLVLTFIYYY